MANFNTTEMAGALTDITNTAGNTNAAVGEGSAQRKVQPGWVAPTPYNYSAYTTGEGKEADAAFAAGEGWAAGAAKYEWSDEFGDVGPANSDLEKELFGREFQMTAGEMFHTMRGMKVDQLAGEKIEPVLAFEDAGLHPVMLKNVQFCGYTFCTPIQAYAIPAILRGHEILASAQTGSGKTAAFLVPILSKLMGKAKTVAARRPNPGSLEYSRDKVRAEPLIVVVAPTRELATQIFDEARRLCYRSMLRPCVVYGGAPAQQQREELMKGCDVLIGTPGRLCDFMNNPRLLSLSRVKYTIIDEADEMLNQDWEAELKKIMAGGDSSDDADHVFMMFSATFPREARALAREYIVENYVHFRVGRIGHVHSDIEQMVIFVAREQKRQALFDLIASKPAVRTIVFVNSKRTADFLDDALYNQGYPSTSMHSNRTQREREDALRSFRRGESPILVATGVSARGLDISEVMHVINFDLPSSAHGGIQEYTHRIGRTGRIGHKGLATSFYNEENQDLAVPLVRLLLENKQEVPDFLQSEIPEGAQDDPAWKLNFDDDTDDEGDDPFAAGANQDEGPSGGAAVPGGAWGTDADNAPAAAASGSAGAWGASNQSAGGETGASAGDWGAQAAPSAPTAGAWGTSATPSAPAAGAWGASAAPSATTKVAADTWGAPSTKTPATADLEKATPAENASSSGLSGWDIPSKTYAGPSKTPVVTNDAGWGAPSTQGPAVGSSGWGTSNTAPPGLTGKGTSW
ncbi:MAG: hypothetical protein M1833_003151 [Piccolia ochrophora]|nr:MAG: hypothetical protein M1833_003151 [Piccolia ochrophora]